MWQNHDLLSSPLNVRVHDLIRSAIIRSALLQQHLIIVIKRCSLFAVLIRYGPEAPFSFVHPYGCCLPNGLPW